MPGSAHALAGLAIAALVVVGMLGASRVGAGAASADVSMLVAGTAALTLVTPGQPAHSVSLPAGVAALARGTDGPVVLAEAPDQPGPRNLGLAALAWSPAAGRVSLLSVDMSTPLMGSMYVGSGDTEVRSLAGVFGRPPFAVMGYFGGGAGYALSVAGDDLLPDPAYKDGGGDPLLPGGADSLDCFPAVLALLRHGRFLLRSAVPSGLAWACRYSVLGPQHGATLLPTMDRAFPSGRAGAAAAACGHGVALLTWNGGVEEGRIGGPWRRMARLGREVGPATEGWRYPVGIACAPDGDVVAATIDGKAAVWRRTGRRLRRAATVVLPRGATSWLPLFASVTRLPRADAWHRALAQAAALAARLDVALPSRAGRLPDVRIVLRAAGHARCEPLLPWTSPTAPLAASVDACAVSSRAGWSALASTSMVLADRADAADATPPVVAAVRHDDLLLPAPGWLPLGARLTVRAALGASVVLRVVQLPAGP